MLPSAQDADPEASLLAAFNWRGLHASLQFEGQDLCAANISLSQASITGQAPNIEGFVFI